MKQTTCILILLFSGLGIAGSSDERPNILLVISDDQSWPHASAYGNQSTDTPTFDRVAAIASEDEKRAEDCDTTS